MQLPSTETHNETLFQFMKLDLELADTFLQLADVTSLQETKDRTRSAARKIYATVLRFSLRTKLDARQEADLRSGLAKLKRSLELLGETV